MIRDAVRAFCAAAALGWLINRGGVPVPIATWGAILIVGGAWLAFVIERERQDRDDEEEIDHGPESRPVTTIRRSGGDPTGNGDQP